MNTKTIRTFLFILISALTLSMLSCKNGSGTYTGSDKQPLNITIAQNEMIKFTKNSSSRTIVAAPFSVNADANTGEPGLIFYLWGKAHSGQTLEPKNVTVTSDDGVVGKVILDIDCFNWSLTLAACAANDAPSSDTEEAIMQKAVLIGYGNVDMMFTNQIKFTLTPKGLTKTGKVDLTLQLASGMVIPTDYVAKAYIYDIITGLPVADGLSQTISSFTTASNYTANNANIAPGTYSFQIEFTKAGENRKYVWNDTIIILPGKTAKETIVIPNLIGSKPAAPSNFTVQLNKKNNPSDKTDPLDEAEESVYPGYYTAHFTWDGSAVKTEMNFALQIAELPDNLAVDSPVISDAAFNAIFGREDDETTGTPTGTVNAKYAFNYLNDIRANQRFYKDGSLFANSDYVDVYLELGKRYIARLYSENNAGYSENPCYLTISPTGDTGVTTLNTINRFRVKYYTQGGVWNEGEARGGSTEKLNDKIVYWSQSNADYTVLNPVSSALDANNKKIGSSGHPYLYSGAADWIYWIQDLTAAGDTGKYATVHSDPNDNTSPMIPAPYTDFKNLDLYASYSREGDIEIYNDKNYDILQAWVEAFGLTGTVSKTDTNVVSKHDDLNDATSTTVSVTVPTTTTPAGTWKYDTVSFAISYAGRTYFNQEQVGKARATANEFEIPLTNLPTGYVYNCLITARYQMTTVSYPFTIYLTD